VHPPWVRHWGPDPSLILLGADLDLYPAAGYTEISSILADQ
jgi:hypothetical protein